MEVGAYFDWQYSVVWPGAERHDPAR